MRKLTFDPGTIQEKARDIVDKSLGNPILMLGHPKAVKPNDPTASTPTENHCSHCGIPVWSTELKDEVMKVAPNQGLLLCLKCFTKEVEKLSEPKIS